MPYSAKSDDSGTINQFTRRKEVIITTGGTSTPADYQVKLTITYESEMQADFDDLRFNTLSGGYIDYWIESYTASTTATVWVELPDAITHPGNDSIYMFYGNTSLQSESNGTDTFVFFEGFETYIKNSNNPIIEHSTGADDQDNYQLYSGQIIEEDTDTWRMYYCANKSGVNIDQIFTATSPKSNNFTNWTKYTSGGDVTPVIAIGSNGDFDDSNAYFQTALLDGSTYKIWYLGDDGSVGPHYMEVGYATSSDGESWSKYNTTGIYSDTADSANGIEYIAVLKDGSNYYMAYSPYLTNKVHIATSNDGITWSKDYTNVVQMQVSSLIKVDSTYYMFGIAYSEYGEVKCYSSTDLTNWTDRSIQLIDNGSGWEQRTYHPKVFHNGNYFEMVYSGWDGSIYPEVGIARLISDIPYYDLSGWPVRSGTWGLNETRAEHTGAVRAGEMYCSIQESINSAESFVYQYHHHSDYAFALDMIIQTSGYADENGEWRFFNYFDNNFARFYYNGGSSASFGTWAADEDYVRIAYNHTDSKWYIESSTDGSSWTDRGSDDVGVMIVAGSNDYYLTLEDDGLYGNGWIDYILRSKYIANEPTPSYGTAQHQRRTPQFIG